jgi:hypothetical protein
VGLTDKISTLIFALIVIAVIVYVVMSRIVVGPLSRLKRIERIILGAGLVGILAVLVYAAVELLLHVLL